MTDWAATLLFIVGLTAAVFVSTNHTMCWNAANDVARGYLVQRALVFLVAFVDVPIAPSVPAAAVFWWVSRRPQQSNNASTLSANHNLRSSAKQVEDFGDVAIGKADGSF